MSDQPIRELLVRSTARVSTSKYNEMRGEKQNLTFVVLPLVNILKVVDTGVVVVLAREDNIVQVLRVGIGNGVA